MAKDLFATVAIDTAINKTLDYRIPKEFAAHVYPGTRVSVPLKGTLQRATVLERKESSIFTNALPIAALLNEENSLPSDLMQLGHWMSRYYAASLRKVLRVLMPPIIRKEGKYKTQLWVRPLITGKALITACALLQRSKPSQGKALELLLQSPKGMFLTEVLEQAKISRSPLNELVKAKYIAIETMQLYRSPLIGEEYFPTQPKKLNEQQSQVLEKILDSQRKNHFEVHLVHGITGSGKTELYLQAIDACLLQGKGVILLVPEIALTSQIVEKLKGRFKEKVALLHHRLSDGEKHDAWHKIKSGEIPLIIGARSAIFTPIPRLGLVIIDEEHESSYKQTEEAPCYNARDVAILRAKFSSATVILGSATPSLESYYNAQQGKYILSTLTMRADKKAALPSVKIVDMNREFEKKKGFTLFSDALLSSIENRVECGEQTVLFLNRRGYHTTQVCSGCSHVIKCTECDVCLTYHLGNNVLSCHLCDYHLFPPPRNCPSCGAETLKYKGAGTEMVERTLHAIFPHLRTLRLDADTTRRKGSHDQLFKQFRAGKADLLIGTQMIAKGLHFPSVTLAGILNADAALSIPDFRASEKTFQLLTQVAGRSGRGQIPGEVIIQTHFPDHPIIQAAAKQDYEAFFIQELASRKMFEYPPFSHLIKIILSGTNVEEVSTTAATLRKLCIENLPAAFEVHPVIPCGHAKIKGRYRFQFLIKGSQRSPDLDFLNSYPLKHSLHLLIDIDPLSTFF